jgi:amino acid adenylation domain-containing protein
MSVNGQAGHRHDSLALILRHAADRPAAPAAKDDAEALTYGQLRERAVAFASGLSALGVGPGDRVALWLPNSVAFVAAALGCLWIGASFVPLSVDDPPARLARIVDDSDPKIIVGRDDAVAPVGSSPRRTADVRTILGLAGPTPERATDPERDAYLIYTSGTTGVAKGVRIPERAFGWAIVATEKLLGLDPTTRSLCVSPFYFDGSYGTLFPTLVAGGSVSIPKREELLFVKRFYRAVLEEGITHTGFSPSYLRLVLSSPKLPSLGRSRLRTLGLGGEECLTLDLARLWDVLPGLRIFNRYGPTETTIEVTTHEVDRATISSGPVPIGAPHPGVSFYLVGDDQRVITGRHEVGELYIGGNQLMRGYWGDDALTAKVLRADVVAGETLYKTGDLVYQDQHGQYVYVGRSDDVVKRRGVRISLDEIARVLRGVETVSGVVCVPTDFEGRLGVAAFVEAGPEMNVPALLQAARAQVPATMLPDEIFILGSLPMTTSGKIDRGALLTAAGRKSWRPRKEPTWS